MTIQEARETVVLAGRRLVESGLIARTWGNVSCRISDTHFVITPSGRDYLTLQPEEIVEVAIADLSYQGSLKPSSEKGVHAEVYKLHPEVNFVIHTHQDHASSVSVLGMDSVRVANAFPLLKGEVICAQYGLPGTKKLRKGVSAALARSKGKAVIMKNHGALCFGADYEETFQVAKELENACEQFILDQFHKIGDNTINEPIRIGCFALTKLTGKAITFDDRMPLLPFESERKPGGFCLKVGDITYDFTFSKKDAQTGSITCQEIGRLTKTDPALLKEAWFHNQIYEGNDNIHNIIHANTPGIIAVSCARIKLLPLLDDFAQIAGTSVATVETDGKEVAKALISSSAVLIESNGALCCGGTKGDALASALVTEKNSNALITAALFDRVKYIKRLECKLMRFVYLKKYSKQLNKK